jgi:hypothetical protein
MVDLLGHARLVDALTLACCRARLSVEADGVKPPPQPVTEAAQARRVQVEVLIHLEPVSSDPF